MKSLTITSPAKVNLHLEVLKKRADGYHELLTIFHRISLADTLTLQKKPAGITIQTNHPGVPTGHRNMIWKAFEMVKKDFPFEGGVTVRLKKRIPVAGGLGGGSSNAASFLLGLKRLYRLPLTQKALLKMGARLGADVNFFLLNTRQALGEGAGERLKSLSCQKRFWFVLVTMPKALSTARVYSVLQPADYREPSLTKKIQIAKLPHGLSKYLLAQKQVSLRNDLQAASIRCYPALSRVLKLFDSLNVKARLISGSGPSVFGVTTSKNKAAELAKQIRKSLRTYKQIIVCHSL
ncbi:MAG: 4-(cytidine 5'-diphospho)-2-C-methyl-D-erythritol kinase [Candidatus Omnitrophica bacterium CG11_big_fil_rev_8_21_14_0_20_45_26]|uniref:4-diphosphocytidyl-2-C-methyl-D-erythritol kinase n=1 Tax=Candidatus Abzuiibacterium crystallinum TaxID=1974748 RepID=A0A2H0LSS5_9BACT|nr:MAG: 4-(cytidine 5'-diphospho)-2-C-methyl-D-erythritol kinase [Candidatus Omnitrophica bacterium CG11_big_fil_rev_8_21_14_0_20_45_26]PIW63365.1 MAG: 4-(cytidine 5'-diphospho)-2-C-methyl-D-erythritol kinase [Candidatus Omnitrophica bacterium CG12_big_fil_rev_8_21_14_0_65_45_16]